MQFRHLVITGGAGFVGATLAEQFRRAFASVRVTAFDNLERRGSELNLPRLRAAGVVFVQGDIRRLPDLEALPAFDLLVDCSAEPSVQAGMTGSPLPMLQTNLVGTIHCLEAARRRGAAFLFLSTSRVYPIGLLNALPYAEGPSRFSWTGAQGAPGCSVRGIAEEAPLAGARSLYGATKLSSELLLQEYAAHYHMPVLINRCGVLSGPWQMGKVDQGVVALWVARHVFDCPLRYVGFGGEGKQVRDVLHVDDLFDLISLQCEDLGRWDGRAYNVGGGTDRSVSLLELTALCRSITGRTVALTSVPETSPVDVRIFITDSARVQADFAWRPRRSLEDVVRDLRSWIERNEALVKPVFAG